MQLSRVLTFKRPQYAKRHDKVFFQHDNTWPHVAKVFKKTLEALNWDVLPHPPYSPGINPSNNDLFQSMAHGLAEQHFTFYEEAKTWVDSCIASKDEKFFERGIRIYYISGTCLLKRKKKTNFIEVAPKIRDCLR